MNALFLYNKNSGFGILKRKIAFIVKSLNETFEVVDVVPSISKEHFLSTASEACGKYDVLVFAGGDGTFNMVANAISKHDVRPIIGIIPTGTVNDAARNFHITRNVKKCLKIIKNQKITKFDICKINDTYFTFASAIGVFTDIPYLTKVSNKKKIGRLAYYLKAIPSIFKRSVVKGTIKINDEVIPFETPFFLVMNSARVGGFKINPKSDMRDGVVDIFISKPAPLNSLLQYLFKSKKVKLIQASEFHVNIDSSMNWDIDGEMGFKGDAHFKVVPNHLTIFCK